MRTVKARADLASSGTEVQTGQAEREARRLERVRETRNRAHPHQWALPHQDLLPHREKMLIQVKGRNFCQSRLVPPVPGSLNSGDCFVLVTSSQVFCWIGRFSNKVERARAAEVALCVLQKKDLGCQMAVQVETVEEEKLSLCERENQLFWRCLTGREGACPPKTVAGAGAPEEDEVSKATGQT